uniref:Thioredoxin domain-containing protein n=1 Tax=Caenorhabditis japonica TaxID=281687 RepID=A0A8R1EUG1_CAEJA
MPVVVVNGDSDFSRKFSAANGKAVFIDFTASWCGPCKYIAPVFDDLANQYKGSVFLKVDVDECSGTAQSYGVNAMPTFMAFVGGQKKATIQGADESGLRSMVAKYASTSVAWSGTGQVT